MHHQAMLLACGQKVWHDLAKRRWEQPFVQFRDGRVHIFFSGGDASQLVFIVTHCRRPKIENCIYYYAYFCYPIETRIKISIVNYTNTLPFRWALRRSPLLKTVDLQEDIPSICAQKLKYRQVDLALVPVALLPELDNYRIETSYCIGADGIVDSVKLYSDVPLEDIKEIVLDYHSRSSITLTRVLSRFFWKIHVLFMEAKPGFENEISGTRAAVVIGDRTFALNGRFRFEYDLAEHWKKFTGLPFVFAAWVSNEKLNDKFIVDFNGVLKYGICNIERAVKESYTGEILPAREIVHYLSERIDYHLDKKKLEALGLFLSYIARL
jgi:chorismate dehydratase